MTEDFEEQVRITEELLHSSQKPEKPFQCKDVCGMHKDRIILKVGKTVLPYCQTHFPYLQGQGEYEWRWRISISDDNMRVGIIHLLTWLLNRVYGLDNITPPPCALDEFRHIRPKDNIMCMIKVLSRIVEDAELEAKANANAEGTGAEKDMYSANIYDEMRRLRIDNRRLRQDHEILLQYQISFRQQVENEFLIFEEKQLKLEKSFNSNIAAFAADHNKSKNSKSDQVVSNPDNSSFLNDEEAENDGILRSPLFPQPVVVINEVVERSSPTAVVRDNRAASVVGQRTTSISTVIEQAEDNHDWNSCMSALTTEFCGNDSSLPISSTSLGMNSDISFTSDDYTGVAKHLSSLLSAGGDSSSHDDASMMMSLSAGSERGESVVIHTAPPLPAAPVAPAATKQTIRCESDKFMSKQAAKTNAFSKLKPQVELFFGVAELHEEHNPVAYVTQLLAQKHNVLPVVGFTNNSNCQGPYVCTTSVTLCRTLAASKRSTSSVERHPDFAQDVISLLTDEFSANSLEASSTSQATTGGSHVSVRQQKRQHEVQIQQLFHNSEIKFDYDIQETLGSSTNPFFQATARLSVPHLMFTTEGVPLASSLEQAKELAAETLLNHIIFAHSKHQFPLLLLDNTILQERNTCCNKLDNIIKKYFSSGSGHVKYDSHPISDDAHSRFECVASVRLMYSYMNHELVGAASNSKDAARESAARQLLDHCTIDQSQGKESFRFLEGKQEEEDVNVSDGDESH